MTQATVSRGKRAQGRASVKFHSVSFAAGIGECSPAIVIRRVDEQGNPAEPKGSINVRLNSDSASGTFSEYQDFSTTIHEVTIKSGESDAVFYYRDYNAGTPTISISRQDLEDEQAETIRKGILTAKADDIVVAYGTIPAFTGTLLVGLVGPDSKKYGVSYGCGGNPTDAGFYRIEPTISPAGWEDNYIFRPADGRLTIEKAAVTVTANDQTVVYGNNGNDLAFTASAEPASFPPAGGHITMTPQCRATKASDAGTYEITPLVEDHGTGELRNYAVIRVNGKLTINPAPLSAQAATPPPITLGDPIPPFTGTVTSPPQNNDYITVSYVCAATPASAPGQYVITPVFDQHGTGKLKNYSVQTQTATLTINPVPVTPPSTVQAFVFFKDLASGSPQPIGLPNLPLSLEVASKTIPGSTDANGNVSLTVPGPLAHAEVGTLHIPQAQQLGGLHLRPTAKGPIYLQLDPSQPSLNLRIEYEKAPGELWLDATTQGKRLGGVHLSLFPSSPASDKPVRTVVTSATSPTVITGLADGQYNVLVSSEPLHHEGRAIELDCPQDGWLNASIAAGQQFPLLGAIQFRPSVGRISAVVSDAGTGRGLAQVPVTVTPHEGHHGQPVTLSTDRNGEVVFSKLAPGEYTVKLAQIEITLHGINWVPKGDSSHKVVVRPSATTAASEFHMQQDIPRIEGQIFDEDGNPFRFAEVVIYGPSGDQILDTVIADEAGKFVKVVSSKGVYYIGPKQDSAGATAIKTPVTVRSPGQVVATFRRGISGAPGAPGAPAGGKQVREAFTDLAAYPILTEEIGYPPAPVSMPSAGGVSAPAPGTAALGQIAMKAVADVLGWKIKSDDPKGFVGALNQAFTITEVEGHVESKWVPRSYAVQSDLSGGLTGAQASLYSRAQDALDKSLPLLNGLYALDPAADPEDIEALREVVRDQMTQLVNELGYAGGPRVARVNQYFFLLLGPPLSLSMSATNPIQFDPDKIQGTLGNLRDVYGIATLPKGKPNPLVNTVDDEQDTTNFRVLSDYMTSLAQSWLSNLQFFVLPTTPSVSSTPFLGTQLVLISRQLSVTSELVDDARFALDSVFIGASERQTLLITFNPATGFAPIFQEDLLSWIQRLVNEEAPSVIQSAGKFGVYQIVQVLTQLQQMLADSVNPANTKDIPAGYFTPRVQRALTALADQVQELINLATPVGTKRLVSVA